jgi:hypothetical protein
MTDLPGGAATESQSIFRLIYRSHSLIASDESKNVLGEIFTTARHNNKRLGVTGALVVSEDVFVQALEGDEPVVRDLYATISKDPRHDDVRVLEEQVVEGRTFGRWAMAKVATDGGADIRLMSNASKGVIVAAARGADPTATPEQEAVLASMRNSIAVESA